MRVTKIIATDSTITCAKLDLMPPSFLVESQSTSPVAHVVTSNDFLGKHLSQLLRSQNLQVVCSPTLPHHPPDYLFYFSSRLISTFPPTAKVLLCLPLDLPFPPRFFSLHPNLRLVRLSPHVYGPGMDLSASNPLAQLFSAIKLNQPLLIPGDGLQPIYPVFITDAVTGLAQAMFTTGTAGQEFVLIPYPSTTLLDFAYLLRRLAPGRQIINFSPQANLSTPPPRPHWLIGQKHLRWQPQISLTQGIRHTLSWLEQSSPPPLSSSPSPLALRRPERSQRGERGSPSFPRWLTAGLITLALSLPLILFSVTSLFGLQRLQLSQTYLRTGQLASSFTAARQAETLFQPPRRLLLTLSFSSSFFRLEKIFLALTNLAQGQADLAQAGLAATSAAPAILNQGPLDPLAQLSETQLYLDQAKTHLSLAYAELGKPRPQLENVQFFKIGASLQGFRRSLTSSLQAASIAQAFTTTLTNLLAGPKKTYLVLFQNNGELRPTGGFIDSLALVTVATGRILDLEFFSVYAVDSQLQGQVVPPSPIKTYLGETSWYLRDSNWDPDFPTTARQAEWFIGKELNRQPAGTLALNFFVVQKLLQVLGEVQLPGTSQPLTAANLFDRAQTSPQLSLAPGAPPVQTDIFSSTLETLYRRLTQLDSPRWFSLATAITQLLDQKQLLISPVDSHLALLLQHQGWDGSLAPRQFILPPRVDLKSHYSDFINLSEANLGVNKSNFFITRNIHHQLRFFKEDNLIATTIVTYYNASPSNTWPVGTYKNYLRFYLPLGSTLEQLLLNDQIIPLRQVDFSIDHNQTVFGFLVSIPPQEQRRLTLTYKLPGQLNFINNRTFYSLVVPKQSGTSADPLTVSLTLPPYYRVVSTTPPREPVPGTVTFLTDLATDRVFTLELEK